MSDSAAPVRADAPAVLVQLTDMHLFDEPHAAMLGVDTEASLQAVLRQVGKDGLNPDALLLTGDLSQDGSPASYQRLHALLAQTGLPVRCLPGNHDAPATLRAELGAWTDPVLDLGAWRIVLLDSTVPGSNGGHLADDQLDLLSRAASLAGDRPLLVAVHHNPVQGDPDWHDTMMLDNAQLLFQRLQRLPQARVLLWGHVHQEFDCRRHNLRMLATPSTCFQFVVRDGKHCVDDAAPGYRWLKLYADGSLATGVRRLDDARWRALLRQNTG
ncbi:phosphodiesterase [Bordetella bronchiseptica]|uniref:phosphodiesterase n=1 Tax=Bordetella bronchiseptica TaxID=518 RepID=UPI000460C4BE|nr:phosphodiesterase [Bordetella bronchiseptica]KDD11223.1 putative 3',5'-cyclic-nucleotide phosphodiesterase [Bordetella bronchiseptica MBORD707]